MTSIVFIKPERMKTLHRLWYFELISALKNYKFLKLLHFNKRILYERQLGEHQVDKIVKVLEMLEMLEIVGTLEMLAASNFKENVLKIVAEKCAHLPQPINRIRPVEMNMSVRDLFHENHVAMSKKFKAWTDINRVRSELDLDLDLGDVMSNFGGLRTFHISV